MRQGGGVLLLAVAMVASTFVGCLGTGENLLEQAVGAELDRLVEQRVHLWEDEGFEISARVNVVLVGFDPGTAEALETALEPQIVRHEAVSTTRDFPPFQGEDVSSRELPMPVTPRVSYEVQGIGPEVADGFFASVREHPAEDPGDTYDANAAEDLLAEILPDQGIELDEDVPTFVVLHAGDRLGGDHAWRFTYRNGHLEPVRAFGERHPITVYDVSAEPDPFVVGSRGNRDVEAYNVPLEPGGQETVHHLADLTVDATHHRLMKGAIFPVSTKPCHKITLLFAVQQTALTELAPGYRRAEAWVDRPALQAAFQNATGDEVATELETITLPQDDPALDAVVRQALALQDTGDPTGQADMRYDAVRWYLDENWDRYVDTQPGCEHYLSMLLYADATPGFVASGTGFYDVNADRRISFSIVSDLFRMISEGPTDEQGSYGGGEEPDIVNRLFSHETGHILGLHHPQHVRRAEGGLESNDAFQSVWSSMSYQVVDRTIDFGALDRSQFQRNRAGYIVQQAQVLDLEGTPAFERALEAAAQYDWVGVQHALEGVVQAKAQATLAGGPPVELVPDVVVPHHRHGSTSPGGSLPGTPNLNR